MFSKNMILRLTVVAIAFCGGCCNQKSDISTYLKDKIISYYNKYPLPYHVDNYRYIGMLGDKDRAQYHMSYLEYNWSGSGEDGYWHCGSKIMVQNLDGSIDGWYNIYYGGGDAAILGNMLVYIVEDRDKLGSYRGVIIKSHGKKMSDAKAVDLNGDDIFYADVPSAR